MKRLMWNGHDGIFPGKSRIIYEMQELWHGRGVTESAQKKQSQRTIPEKTMQGRQSSYFWMQVLGVAEMGDEGKPGLTDFGKTIMENDPFLEKNETLWMLHYNTAGGANCLPVWTFFFQILSRGSSSVIHLADQIETAMLPYYPVEKIKQLNMKAEIGMILRAYLGGKSICPHGWEWDALFREMKLLICDHGKIGFNEKVVKELPESLIAWTILRFVAEKNENINEPVCSQRLWNEPGSPGRVLGLTRERMERMLEHLAEKGQIMFCASRDKSLFYLVSSGKIKH